jgi:putative resolvase
MENLFMSKYYSINKFSKILGVSAQTLRNSSNGYRYYSHEQLNQVMNVKPNLDRKELMKRISQNKVDKVVVFYKDRLLRFGFELVEYIASLYDCNIEIIDHTEKTEQQELVEDLV